VNALTSVLPICFDTQDPWIRPQAADKIQSLYPAAQRVDVDAGHCPHDEAPAEVNAAIEGFMQSLSAVVQ
jgi:pimeloyl-ACP methyl ester carboxylesterase